MLSHAHEAGPCNNGDKKGQLLAGKIPGLGQYSFCYSNDIPLYVEYKRASVEATAFKHLLSVAHALFTRPNAHSLLGTSPPLSHNVDDDDDDDDLLSARLDFLAWNSSVSAGAFTIPSICKCH